MRLIKLKDMAFSDKLSMLDVMSVTNIMNVSNSGNIIRYTLPYGGISSYIDEKNNLSSSLFTDYWNIQDVRHIKRPLDFTMPNNHLLMREIINGLKYS